MPMGFCYSATGKSGDLPPRKECAEHWHQDILAMLPKIKLTLLLGQYAQSYYLDKNTSLGNKQQPLTKRVTQWRHYLPDFYPCRILHHVTNTG
jgi:uracil-DNA glycosylase